MRALRSAGGRNEPPDESRCSEDRSTTSAGQNPSAMPTATHRRIWKRREASRAAEVQRNSIGEATTKRIGWYSIDACGNLGALKSRGYSRCQKAEAIVGIGSGERYCLKENGPALYLSTIGECASILMTGGAAGMRVTL